ncbi:MAG: glucose-1-phosphate adenylyltransferase [Candidatus Omnitrophota bacterium]
MASIHNDVLCVVLGGGRGSRIYPLTRDRAKPAVPLFGKYRLVDIPISNCINSGFNKIKILTQFNSESLNKHIVRTYRFDQFSGGFIEVIAAQQEADSADWFQGPADAVRRSLKHFSHPGIKHICVLSGDQLYKMDLRRMYEQHLAKKAEITVACHPVCAQDVSGLGIMGVDSQYRVKEFVEKPKDVKEVRHLALTSAGREYFLCSMGIYFFEVEALRHLLLHSNKADFGKEIIPEAVDKSRVYAYEFDGYWCDIGTIEGFYHENLRLADAEPPLDLYDENWPIFTRSRSLPPAKYSNSKLIHSIVADGSIMTEATVQHSIIGLRSRIGQATTIEDSIVMGADYYENEEDLRHCQEKNIPCVGIGKNCIIRRAIIDKNARIGDRVEIINQKNLKESEGPNYMIHDGIVIVYKNATIPSGTII